MCCTQYLYIQITVNYFYTGVRFNFRQEEMFLLMYLFLEFVSIIIKVEFCEVWDEVHR